MMQKKFLIFFWLLQDCLQVLLLGFCIVPNLYLTYLLLVTLLDFSNDTLASEALLWAFVGGLLYDLRWTNIPGVSPLAWCLGLAVASAIWGRIPQNTRNQTACFYLIFVVLVLSELVNFAFFVTANVVVFRLLLLNIVINLLIAFISSVVFMRNKNSDF